jgi:hypothetical protein
MNGVVPVWLFTTSVSPTASSARGYVLGSSRMVVLSPPESVTVYRAHERRIQYRGRELPLATPENVWTMWL